MLSIVSSLRYDSFCIHNSPVTDDAGHSLTASKDCTSILHGVKHKKYNNVSKHHIYIIGINLYKIKLNYNTEQILIHVLLGWG